MKIRLGHVTNSSSSSFIIGKREDETVTIESVYQMIRTFYKEALKARDNFKNYIEAHPELNVVYCVHDGWEEFTFSDKGKVEDTFEARIQILDNFDIDMWSYYKKDKDYEWVYMCNTYEEYTKYWIDRIKDNKHNYAPFTIIDYLKSNMGYNLHYGSLDISMTEIGIESNELGWYYPYLEEAIADDCDNCDCRKWCNREDCENTKQMLNEFGDFPKEKACLYLLGRVAILSECGYIHDSVVEKLKIIAEYSCNHMG